VLARNATVRGRFGTFESHSETIGSSGKDSRALPAIRNATDEQGAMLQTLLLSYRHARRATCSPLLSLF
jgi:hypothetical protein